MPPITLLGPTRTGRMTRMAPRGGMRAIEVNGRPVIQLQIVQYDVLDSYRTVFRPGSCAETLEERMPQLCLNHDWSDVVGRAQNVVSDDVSTGPLVDFYLNDFDAVPNARKVYAQVMDGTLDECSVGFEWEYDSHSPTDDELKRWPGADEIITRVALNEVSVVLRGAVPGAKVTGFRTRFGATRSAPLTRSSKWIEEEEVAQIVVKLVSPEIDFSLTDALNALRDAAIEHPGDPNEDKKEDAKTEEEETSNEEETSEEETEENTEVTSAIEETAIGGDAETDDSTEESTTEEGTETTDDSADVSDESTEATTTDVLTDAEVDAALELAGRF